MSKEHELPSSSDDDDEDYVPETGDCEPVSEVESEGDAESAPEDDNDENKLTANGRKGKKIKKPRKKSAGRKTQSSPDEAAAEDDKAKNLEKTQLTEEEEKKRADSLWADFMKDTGTVAKAKPAKSANGTRSISPVTRPKVEEKVKITKIFEFAGEEVKVEQEVSADSAEARLSLPTIEKTSNNGETSEKSSRGSVSSGRGIKRAGLGGISSVLGQLGKKAKISTLEKSKLDWDSFKREENIDEEINTHNRGKDGFLERQDFLQRADVRQFELEKQMRLSRRTTR